MTDYEHEYYLKKITKSLDDLGSAIKKFGDEAQKRLDSFLDGVFEHNCAVFSGEKDPNHEKLYSEEAKCEQNVNKDGNSSETNSENGADDEKMVRFRTPTEFTFTIEGQENIDKLWKAANLGVKSFSDDNYIPEDEKKEEKEGDNVNHPAHYASASNGIECIDAIEAATEDLEGLEAVCTANVLKYIWRWKHKNGIEDLKKARWYLEKLIEKVEKGEKN